MDYSNWVTELLVAFEDRGSDRIIQLLFRTKIRDQLPNRNNFKANVNAILARGFREDENMINTWSDFLIFHIQAVTKMRDRFKNLNESFNKLLAIFKDDLEGAWSLAVMHAYIKQVYEEGLKSKQLDEVANSFRTYFSICQSTKVPPPDSKVMGMYFALIYLFKVFFKLNKLQPCSSLLRPVHSEHSKLPPISSFPKSQQVEFKYYEGRFCIYDQQFTRAEACLELALKHCPAQSISNKRKILMYLIPVKAWRGVFPTRDLIQKYSLNEFGDLLEAVRNGRIGEYISLMESKRNYFIKQGIYVMMETLKLLAYRNLFLQAYRILNDSKISLNHFLTALKVSGVPNFSIEELECILANLIFKGWVKGYISSHKKILVLSRADPFPKISNIKS